jgi:hypothetical protein
LSAAVTTDDPRPGEQPANRLSGFAKLARERIRRNLASRPRVHITPPVEADDVSPLQTRRAEAALLISAILGLRPDLGGELQVVAGAASLIEPDLLAQIDRIAAQQGGEPDEAARVSLINAIVRDWLSASERVAPVAAR